MLPYDVVDIGDAVVVLRKSNLNIGDRFKDKESGKIYVLTVIFDNHSILLEGENGKGRKITDEGALIRTCEKLEEKKS